MRRCPDVYPERKRGLPGEPRIVERIPDLISAEIGTRYGYQIPVVLRTTEQIRDVIANNPYLKAGVAEDELHVLFLANLPARHRIDDLDPARSPSDSFAVQGQEVYLRLPNGAASSKLTNQYFDSKLATISTGRNWRTVQQLLEMMKA